jgi:hypothetical protein
MQHGKVQERFADRAGPVPVLLDPDRRPPFSEPGPAAWRSDEGEGR